MRKLKTIISLGMSVCLLGGIFTGCGNTNTDTTASNAKSSIEETDEKNNFDNSSMISVISREDGSGTRGAFIELFGIEEKDADGNKIDHTTIEADIVSKTDVMLTTVSGDPYAIGYVSLGSLNESVKAVKINGVAPSVETIKDGSYEISRPFNIATKAEISEAAQDFMNFIMSNEGQTIIEDNKYIKIEDSAETYQSNGASGKVVVAGSSSVTPVMEKLAEAYMAVNSEVQIEVQQSDSSTGMQSAIDGTCDIGMASRDLKDSELEKLTATAIALDGIAVILNVENTTDDMTKDQVRGIFTGEITDWKLQ